MHELWKRLGLGGCRGCRACRRAKRRGYARTRPNRQCSVNRYRPFVFYALFVRNVRFDPLPYDKPAGGRSKGCPGPNELKKQSANIAKQKSAINGLFLFLKGMRQWERNSCLSYVQAAPDTVLRQWARSGGFEFRSRRQARRGSGEVSCFGVFGGRNGDSEE